MSIRVLDRPGRNALVRLRIVDLLLLGAGMRILFALCRKLEIVRNNFTRFGAGKIVLWGNPNHDRNGE
jgi:hypothetical protein